VLILIRTVTRVTGEKNLTPRNKMKIYEAGDSKCVMNGTTEANMQDMPSAAAIVSAGRHYTHHSLPRSAELPSVSLLRAVSHCLDNCWGFTLSIDGSLYKYSS